MALAYAPELNSNLSSSRGAFSKMLADISIAYKIFGTREWKNAISEFFYLPKLFPLCILRPSSSEDTTERGISSVGRASQWH